MRSPSPPQTPATFKTTHDAAVRTIVEAVPSGARGDYRGCWSAKHSTAYGQGEGVRDCSRAVTVQECVAVVKRTGAKKPCETTSPVRRNLPIVVGVVACFSTTRVKTHCSQQQLHQAVAHVHSQPKRLPRLPHRGYVGESPTCEEEQDMVNDSPCQCGVGAVSRSQYRTAVSVTVRSLSS